MITGFNFKFKRWAIGSSGYGSFWYLKVWKKIPNIIIMLT